MRTDVEPEKIITSVVEINALLSSTVFAIWPAGHRESSTFAYRYCLNQSFRAGTGMVGISPGGNSGRYVGTVSYSELSKSVGCWNRLRCRCAEAARQLRRSGRDDGESDVGVVEQRKKSLQDAWVSVVVDSVQPVAGEDAQQLCLG